MLSIKPEFVEKISSGAKRYEYRSRVFKNAEVSSIIVYSTKPVGKIVGEFSIEKIIQETPSELWKKTKNYSGITEDYFKKYFQNKEKGYAIQIREFRQYERPLELKELGVRVAPQSFMYINN